MYRKRVRAESTERKPYKRSYKGASKYRKKSSTKFSKKKFYKRPSATSLTAPSWSGDPGVRPRRDDQKITWNKETLRFGVGDPDRCHARLDYTAAGAVEWLTNHFVSSTVYLNRINGAAAGSAGWAPNFFDQSLITTSDVSFTDSPGITTLGNRYGVAYVTSNTFDWRVELEEATTTITMGMIPLTNVQHAQFTGTFPHRVPPPGSSLPEDCFNYLKLLPGLRTATLTSFGGGKPCGRIKYHLPAKKWHIPGYPLASRTFWSISLSDGSWDNPSTDDCFMYFFLYADANMALGTTGMRMDLSMSAYVTASQRKLPTTLALFKPPKGESKEEKKDDFESKSWDEDALSESLYRAGLSSPPPSEALKPLALMRSPLRRADAASIATLSVKKK